MHFIDIHVICDYKCPFQNKTVIFQIVFRAVESQPGFGFIFLDNITITNGFCGTLYVIEDISYKC